MDKTENFDKSPESFQTCYWVEFALGSQKISSKAQKTLAEKIIKDDDQPARVDL
jgi:hypothetical protein